MKKTLISFCSILLVFMAATLLYAGGRKYLPDYPGRASAKVDTGNTGDYKLNPAEASAYHQNLRRLADLLLAQPTLSRPRGITIEGFIGAHPISSFTTHPPVLSAPVPGSGQFYFEDCLEIDGKPVWLKPTPYEMRIAINDPEHSGLHFFGGGAERDTQGRYIYFMSTKIGEVQGFPLYRNKDGFDTLILTHSPKLIWLPLPQEEFLKLEIRRMEKELAESGSMGQDPSNPYRQRLERHKAILAGMPASERQAQAVYLSNENVLDPDLAPSGSEEGLPLVVANRDWFDPAAPRTAIQLMAFTFACNLRDDPNDTGPPTEDLPVSCQRLWEMKQTADWKAVSAILSP